MGIRIHKVLGYGLSDVKTNSSGEINDPRINAKSPLVNWRESKSKKDLTSYLDFVAKKIDADPDDFDADFELFFLRAQIENPSKEMPNPYDTVTHEGEGGMERVLMLTPIMELKEWQRSDDTIDYYEDHLNNPDVGSPSLKLIEGGIYPYSGAGYVNARTGEKVNWGGLDVLKFVKKEYEAGKIAKGEYQSFIENIGFESEADMDKNLCPKVPEPIKLLIEWGKLFTSPETIYQLRPYLYTYWN